MRLDLTGVEEVAEERSRLISNGYHRVFALHRLSRYPMTARCSYQSLDSGHRDFSLTWRNYMVPAID